MAIFMVPRGSYRVRERCTVTKEDYRLECNSWRRAMPKDWNLLSRISGPRLVLRKLERAAHHHGAAAVVGGLS